MKLAKKDKKHEGALANLSFCNKKNYKSCIQVTAVHIQAALFAYTLTAPTHCFIKSLAPWVRNALHKAQFNFHVLYIEYHQVMKHNVAVPSL